VDGTRIFHGASVPEEVDQKAFFYFAISIFWRASIAKWDNGDGRYFGVLGAYEKSFRASLLGTGLSLPKVALDISVALDKDAPRYMNFPVAEKVRTSDFTGFRHSFVIPGLRFDAFVGGDAAEQAQLRGTQPLFVEWGSSDHFAAYRLRSKVVPTGILAQHRS
jgi:hypothetical protein